MSTSSKKITLKSSDEETFEVMARESQVIKTMFELDPNCMDSVIPLPKITSKILAKVIEYCTKHVEAENNTAAVNEELKAWDASFVMVDQDTLVELIEVANVLDIKGLLDVTCQAVADTLTGKTQGDMHKTIQIMYGFTPEEQEQIRRENAWAFE